MHRVQNMPWKHGQAKAFKCWLKKCECQQKQQNENADIFNQTVRKGQGQNGVKSWKAIGNMRAENCENVANKIVKHFNEATGRIIDNIVALANLNIVE